ncbi:MAG: hypothetical protein RL728_80 [Bacteroidota bacterium]|jgi:hypothetical protein
MGENEEFIHIPFSKISNMLETFKTCGDFANKNGLQLHKIKYIDSEPFLECTVIDQMSYMLLKIKYGV